MAEDISPVDTLDAAQWETLARRADETHKAHTAFLDYIQMGPGRSLQKLLDRYRGQSGGEAGAEKPPTRRKATLEGWSVKHEWQKRLDAYQVESSQRDQALWEARRRTVRESDWQTGDDLRELAEQLLAQTPQFLKTTRRLIKGQDGQPDREVITIGLDGGFLIRAVKLASDLQRQAAEVQPPTQRHELSGPEGKPLIPVVRVVYDDPIEPEGDDDGDD